MIVNSPNNLIELKEFIKKYDSDNLVLEEIKYGEYILSTTQLRDGIVKTGWIQDSN